MIYVAAIIAALALMFGLLRFSMWLTDRKSNQALAKRLPDASHINGPEQRNS